MLLADISDDEEDEEDNKLFNDEYNQKENQSELKIQNHLFIDQGLSNDDDDTNQSMSENGDVDKNIPGQNEAFTIKSEENDEDTNESSSRSIYFR